MALTTLWKALTLTAVAVIAAAWGLSSASAQTYECEMTGDPDPEIEERTIDRITLTQNEVKYFFSGVTKDGQMRVVDSPYAIVNVTDSAITAVSSGENSVFVFLIARQPDIDGSHKVSRTAQFPNVVYVETFDCKSAQ